MFILSIYYQFKGANRGGGVLAPPILKLAPSNNVRVIKKLLLTKKNKKMHSALSALSLFY